MKNVLAALTVSAFVQAAAAPAAAAPAAATAPEAPPLTHEEIKSTVDKHLGDVKACLKQHGSATGKLVVKFVIQSDGKVTDAKPEHSSSNAALDKCIAGAFHNWPFPKPRGGIGMNVVYPFLFAAPPKPASLEDAQIAETMRAHLPEVKVCYDAALKKKDTIAGTVNVEITIAPTGQVAAAKVKESSTKVPTLDGCIVDRVKTWQFPKPDGVGNFVINYPFVLAVPEPDPKKNDRDKEE